MFKIFLFILLAISISTSSIIAKEVPTTGEILVDVLMARPLGMVACGIGTGMFIVTVPFSLLSNDRWQSIDQSAKRLIYSPFKFTFYRKVGEYYGYMDELEYITE